MIKSGRNIYLKIGKFKLAFNLEGWFSLCKLKYIDLPFMQLEESWTNERIG